MTTPKQSGCKVCGEPAIKSRGLCDRHYRRWKAKYDSFATQAERDEFERSCLAGGWITPRQKGGRPKQDDDPWDEIAAQIVAEAERAEKQQAAKDAAQNPGKTPKRKSG